MFVHMHMLWKSVVTELIYTHSNVHFFLFSLLNISQSWPISNTCEIVTLHEVEVWTLGSDIRLMAWRRQTQIVHITKCYWCYTIAAVYVCVPAGQALHFLVFTVQFQKVLLPLSCPSVCPSWRNSAVTVGWMCMKM